MRKFIPALGLSVALIGCGKFQAPVNFSGEEPLPPAKKSVIYNRPYCEVDHYDYIVDTEFLSYEFTNKESISVGFNIAKGIFEAIGLDFSISQARLTAAMHARAYLNPNTKSVLDANSSAKGSDVGLKGKIDLTKIGLGFEHYSETPIAKLTLKGIENTFAALQKKMLDRESHQGEWMTRVLTIPQDTTDSVILQVGSKAGLRKDDRFAVYNTVHRWRDANKPCESTWDGERKLTDTPVAIVRVIEVNDFVSEAVIETPGVTNAQIQQGAKVEIESLDLSVDKKRKTLGRSVWVRKVQSPPLKVKNNTEVDLVNYATRQIDDVISMQTTGGRYYTAAPEDEEPQQ